MKPLVAGRLRGPAELVSKGAVLIMFILAGQSIAATRYVSPTGADSNNGSSAATAWKTINKVNQATSAGDTVLFKGGQTFSGGIYLGQSKGGTLASPVTFSSYDPATGEPLATGAAPASRAVIDAPASDGFTSFDSGGYVIRNLNFTGPGRDSATKDGLKFYVGGGTVRQARVEIDQVDVSGFRTGITVGGWGSSGGIPYGYDGIRITGTNAFDNKLTGIFTYGQKRDTHRDLLIRDCTAFRNRGDAAATGNSGNGILVNGVTTGLVEHCRAYQNGDIGFGSVGIWTYGVDGITIQFCESYDNRASRTSDGGGFDFDGGTVNSVMQYNYSHGNDGAGYLLAQYQNANSEYGPLSENVIRYNISENDARRRSYGGIMFYGANSTDKVGTTHVYGNTVFMGGTVTDGTPACVRFLGSNFTGLKLYNNIFVATSGKRVVNSDSALAISKAILLRNNYHAPDPAFQLKWGATTYDSLSAWLAAAPTQETVGGSSVALSVDPMFVAPGQGGTLGNTALLPTLAAYRLKAGSPMADTGLDLTAAPYALATGGRDFYGNSHPLGTGYDIGAHERDGYADRDGDGIPDDFEEANGMDPDGDDRLSDLGDNDGLPNLLEYAFGLEPGAGDNHPVEFDASGSQLLKRGVPVVWVRKTLEGTEFLAVFVRRKDFRAARLRYTPRFSGNLADWSNSAAVPDVIAVSGEVELVSIPYPASAGELPARFFRVAVTAND